MSASSSRKVYKHKDEQVTENKVSKPKWLESFLSKTFIDPCEDHPGRRNELNKYCINCDVLLCQYCVSSGPHLHHKQLKVYRYVYKDVVSLASLKKYMDCSDIQPYKSNKRLVIPLNPLPHAGSTLNAEALCNSCTRKLNEPELYRYCCISCKVKGDDVDEPNDSVPPVISIQNPPQENQEIKEENQESKEETSEPPKKRVRRRKGTPHRAPFF